MGLKRWEDQLLKVQGVGEEMRMLVLIGQESDQTSCFSHLYNKIPGIGNLKEKGSVQLMVPEVSAPHGVERAEFGGQKRKSLSAGESTKHSSWKCLRLHSHVAFPASQ